MRCYYEVLGVSKNVENAELKKAYYKMSLQWHPDKNISHSQDTTVMFQQIQEAYRVLSDPQERAWYDSHRAQILQSGGQKVQMGSTAGYEEERIDVFQYFSRSCFKGFDDDEKGFYSVYRKVFEDVADEEIKAAEFANIRVFSDDEEEDSDMENSGAKCNSKAYPTFGFMNSSYADVVAPFYQFWEVFQTKKNYTWVEKYDVRCADSRAERRAMETENRQLRNAAKKKRNEEIRQLVAYVKKRDKRVAAERERVQQAGQQAQARTKQLSKEARQREMEKLTEAWTEELAYGGIASQWEETLESELARLEAELDGVSLRAQQPRDNLHNGSHSDSTDDEYSEGNLYCLACDKMFASLNAKINHESSKKHRKQVELLRQVLISEEQAAESVELDIEVTKSQENSDAEPDLSTTVKLTKRAKKAQRKRAKEAAKLNGVDSSVIDTESKDNETEVPPVAVSPESTQSVGAHKDTNNQQPTTIVCETCSTVFSSRNQLFAHLKQTGHATLKTVSSNQSSKAKRVPKGKR